MNEEPEIPEPMPKFSSSRLWTALLLPPLATLLGTLIVGACRQHEDYGSTFLWVPLVDFFLILGTSAFFSKVVSVRYQGRSWTLLCFFYFIGQIVTCLALWLGSCSLLMR